MPSPRAVVKESYVRTRENPFFNGLLRADSALSNKFSTFNFQESAGGHKIARSTSDICDIRHKILDRDISTEAMDISLDDSSFELFPEGYGLTKSKTSSKVVKRAPLGRHNVQSDSSFDLDDPKEIMTDYCPSPTEANDSLPSLSRPAVEKSYSVNIRKTNLSKIPLPQSAASFFNGNSPQMEIIEFCESINRLNLFMKSRRDDVNAGVPGRFLHVVIGQDVSDVGSVAATIMYAFYLNETLGNDQFCTVPVINMKRAELSSRAELQWLLDSCQIHQSSLIFIDEIDLSYYDLFGSLKLVLLNGPKLPIKQEAFKEAVIEIFNCRKGESIYPWVVNVTMGQDCSCCTLLAEKFAMTWPEILAGQGFSQLLLAGILLDTGNLTSARCTSKDKYMATLLINGAGRFGCSGLYQLLRYKMYDVSELRVADILRKDFKKWTRGKPDGAGSRQVSHVGMSSIGISVEQLLAHGDTSIREIKLFQQMERLRLLMIVSGYYDLQKNFKREILISAESVEVMKNLLVFFNLNASQLPLKGLYQPGLSEEMRAFEIDKVTSRKTIERLLEDFGGTSKA